MKRRHALYHFPPETIHYRSQGPILAPELHPPQRRRAWEAIAITAIVPLICGLFALLMSMLRSSSNPRPNWR